MGRVSRHLCLAHAGFLGYLLLWDRVAGRFSAIESLPVRRAFGLISLAVITAATLQLLLMTVFGPWFWINDVEGFAEVWKQRPLEHLFLFLMLLAGTMAWSIVPRVIIRLSPVERR